MVETRAKPGDLKPSGRSRLEGFRICVAQIGARRHYLVPRALHQAGLLDRLYTDSYIGNKPWAVPMVRTIANLTGSYGARRYLGRNAPDLPPEKVLSFDLLGLSYFLQNRRRRLRGTVSDTYSHFGSLFGRSVIAAGFGAANAVYGFNGASVEIFEAAKQKGLRCILDQTIVPMPIYRSLMQAELEKWPGWQPDLQLAGTDEPLAARDVREWELADLIVCGSQFLADTIGSICGPRGKCCVVPYGFEVPSSARSRPRTRRPLQDGIRLLFVGEVGLRKGVPYLLEALRHFEPGRVQARLVGSVRLAADKIKNYGACAEFIGHVPHSEMASLYHWADALVLPSLCEGSSMTTYEAKQYGLPVICTPNAGAVITDGIDGLLVEPGSVDAIIEAVKRLPALFRHSDRIRTQEQLHVNSFDIYRSELLKALGRLYD